MRAQLPVDADFLVCGERLPPGTASEQRPLGHRDRAAANHHGPPAYQPVKGEQRERAAERPGEPGAGAPEAWHHRRSAGHEAAERRPEPQERDDKEQPPERRAPCAPDHERRGADARYRSPVLARPHRR
jgi:hypothetical protein